MITTMHSDPLTYEARYGWYRRSVLGAIVSLIPTAVAIGLQLPWWFIALFAIATGGIGFLSTVVVASGRRVAVRIDEHGVTLARIPLPTGSRTQVIPWADIEAIRVWHLRVGSRSQGRYISLERRTGSPMLVGQPDFARSPRVAAEIPPASKKLSWFELDHARLQAAVTAFAPATRVVVED